MGSYTRRRFLQSAVAATVGSTLLNGCGSGGSDTQPLSNGPFDVAIVGAGIAGMAAAQKLSDNGYKIVVLEARNRVGGRGFTDNTTFAQEGVGIDVGGQWFHQKSINPLLQIARDRGLHLEDDIGPQFLDPATRTVATGTERDTAQSTLLAVTAAVAAQGLAIDTQLSADISILQTVIDSGITQLPYFPLANRLLGCLGQAEEFDQISTADAFHLLLTTDNDILIPGGMGNFISTFAAQLPISLNTAVQTINYGGTGGVTLATNLGTVTARAVVVTVPMGVLRDDRPGFTPSLPQSHLDAIQQIPMGLLAKIAVSFNKNVFPAVNRDSLLSVKLDSAATKDGPVTEVRVHGSNAAVVLVGGNFGRSIERQGSSAMIQFALDTLADIFGQELRTEWTGRGAASSWLSDPYSLGSYSYARPGGVAGRVALGTGVNNHIFFAGEAVSVNSHSSFHGGYLSGQAAADNVKNALGNPM